MRTILLAAAAALALSSGAALADNGGSGSGGGSGGNGGTPPANPAITAEGTNQPSVGNQNTAANAVPTASAPGSVASKESPPTATSNGAAATGNP